MVIFFLKFCHSFDKLVTGLRIFQFNYIIKLAIKQIGLPLRVRPIL